MAGLSTLVMFEHLREEAKQATKLNGECLPLRTIVPFHKVKRYHEMRDRKPRGLIL
jgi:hypothetical protein